MMVRRQIKKIQNPIVRRAVYGLLALKVLFLKLVVIKSIVFSIATLKVLVIESVFLMALFNMVPHVTFAQGAPVDYQITNSTYPMMTSEGQVVSYLYYFQQAGGGSVATDNVVITSNIPTGMSYHSHEGQAPTSTGGNQVTWEFAGSDNTFGLVILRLLVSPTASGPLHNTVNLTHTNSDPDMTNNTATATVIAQNVGQTSDVDLYVSQSPNITTASITDDIIYTITYGNDGTETSSDTMLYKVLPQELYVISSTQQPIDIQNNNLYIFDLGDIPPGSGGSIEMTTTLFPIVQNGHTIETNAVISSESVEEDISNNIASSSVTVQDPLPNMAVSISAPKTSICVNENLRFTVNISNQSIIPAYNLSVRHPKPNSLSFVGSNKNRTIENPQTYVWSYGLPFFWGSQQTFYFDLKGTSTVNNQSISVGLYEGGERLKNASTSISVVNCQGGGGGGGGDGGIDPILGCTDPAAINYNSKVTQRDNQSCIYPIPGCMDPAATNYNSGATIDDESCSYPPIPGCMDSTANNYNPNANQHSGNCTYDPVIENPILGCTNPLANNYNPNANKNNGTCQFDQQPPTTTDPTDPQTPTPPFTIPQVGKDQKIITPTNPRFLIGPQKPSTKQVEEIKKIVQDLKAQPKPVEVDDTPPSCEARMSTVSAYAIKAGLITENDIPELCEPISRADFAELAVKFILKLSIIEPNVTIGGTFDDIAHLSSTQQFYIHLLRDFEIRGIDSEGKPHSSFRPGDMTTRAEAGHGLAKFLFGPTLPAPKEGEAWFVQSFKALSVDSYVMQDISTPDQKISLGQVLTMMMRIDMGRLFNGTKNARLRVQEGDRR